MNNGEKKGAGIYFEHLLYFLRTQLGDEPTEPFPVTACSPAPIIPPPVILLPF